MRRMSLPDNYIRHLERKLGLNLSSPNPAALKFFAKTVQELARRFNKKNADGPDIYLDADHYRKAYQLYYTSANLLKIYYPLDELRPSGFFSSNKPIRVLDVASGTGSMAWGFMSWAGQNQIPAGQCHLTLSDYSESALRESGSDLKSVFTDTVFQTIPVNLNDPCVTGASYDLVIGGNFLSELSSRGIDNFQLLLEKSLNDDGYALLIEPALRETARNLQAFRDRMLSKGWTIYSPCCTLIPCPLLHDPGDWCHHDIPWERPVYMALMDEMIGHIKKSLKFTYIILTKKNRTLINYISPGKNRKNIYRIVSELFDEKGRYRAIACNDTGKTEFQKNKRNKTVCNEAFGRLRRYNLVEIKNPIPGKRYLNITPETSVDILFPGMD